jgi:hypothetical protein
LAAYTLIDILFRGGREERGLDFIVAPDQLGDRSRTSPRVHAHRSRRAG